jgi:uncharacterized protein (DUF983 family)
MKKETQNTLNVVIFLIGVVIMIISCFVDYTLLISTWGLIIALIGIFLIETHKK